MQPRGVDAAPGDVHPVVAAVDHQKGVLGVAACLGPPYPRRVGDDEARTVAVAHHLVDRPLPDLDAVGQSRGRRVATGVVARDRAQVDADEAPVGVGDGEQPDVSCADAVEHVAGGCGPQDLGRPHGLAAVHGRGRSTRSSKAMRSRPKSMSSGSVLMLVMAARYPTTVDERYRTRSAAGTAPTPAARHGRPWVRRAPGALAGTTHHRRSPSPISTEIEAPPSRGRNASRQGSPSDTMATIVSCVLPRPIVSPCHATLSRPSRWYAAPCRHRRARRGSGRSYADSARAPEPGRVRAAPRRRTCAAPGYGDLAVVHMSRSACHGTSRTIAANTSSDSGNQAGQTSTHAPRVSIRRSTWSNASVSAIGARTTNPGSPWPQPQSNRCSMSGVATQSLLELRDGLVGDLVEPAREEERRDQVRKQPKSKSAR